MLRVVLTAAALAAGPAAQAADVTITGRAENGNQLQLRLDVDLVAPFPSGGGVVAGVDGNLKVNGRGANVRQDLVLFASVPVPTPDGGLGFYNYAWAAFVNPDGSVEYLECRAEDARRGLRYYVRVVPAAGTATLTTTNLRTWVSTETVFGLARVRLD